MTNLVLAIITAAATVSRTMAGQPPLREIAAFCNAVAAEDIKLDLEDLDGAALAMHKHCNGIIPLHKAREVIEAALPCVQPFALLLQTIGPSYHYFSPEAPEKVVSPPSPVEKKAAPAIPDAPVNLRANKPGMPPLYEDSPQPLKPRRVSNDVRNLGKDVLNEDAQ